MIPPMMTRATTDAATSPVSHGGTPKLVRSVSATVLAWIALPVRNAVRPRAPAKKTASGLKAGPRPRSM